MRRQDWVFSIIIILTFAVVGTTLSQIFERFIDFSKAGGKETAALPAVKTRPKLNPGAYNPPSLEDAPEDIKAAILLGYNIMTQTPKYAGRYVKANMSCAGCHFYGGITEGGKNGGISLVGVATKYPRWKQRAKADVDILARTNSCFERSMNGAPLPLGSDEMNALVVYYQWISKGLPVYGDISWLGLPSLGIDRRPDPSAGGPVYRKCVACHGDQGQGTPTAPPLWGPEAFNSGAGMSKIPTFAAFAHLNMPRANPDLTKEQAFDVAAFVTAKPRPSFSDVR